MAGDSPENERRPRDASFRWSCPNEISEVGRANGAVEEFLAGSDVPPDTTFAVTLALEEVVTNIVKYGYDDRDPHRIDIEVRLGPGRVVLEVTDDGHAFDPRSTPPPDFGLPPEDRPIGGLGIHLLRKLTEALEYRRISDRNVLTLTFSTQHATDPGDTPCP